MRSDPVEKPKLAKDETFTESFLVSSSRLTSFRDGKRVNEMCAFPIPSLMFSREDWETGEWGQHLREHVPHIYEQWVQLQQKQAAL